MIHNHEVESSSLSPATQEVQEIEPLFFVPFPERVFVRVGRIFVRSGWDCAVLQAECGIIPADFVQIVIYFLNFTSANNH